jgi:ubiquinone/menaquinone biosynthesis C-methylase UbiE
VYIHFGNRIDFDLSHQSVKSTAAHLAGRLIMWQLYHRHIFPHILDRVMQLDSLSDARQQLLAGVSGHVIEIGFGTGLNIPYYTSAVLSLTTVDPNEYVGRLAERRMDQAPFPIQQRRLSAERMPFEDGSVDAVVSTWTLCSIPHVAQALREIRRILKPNGVFHFVEHSLSPYPSTARWQRRLTPVQLMLADGCHLDRDMVALVEQAGFEWLEQQTFNAKQVPAIGRWMVLGRARPSHQAD